MQDSAPKTRGQALGSALRRCGESPRRFQRAGGHASIAPLGSQSSPERALLAKVGTKRIGGILAAPVAGPEEDVFAAREGIQPLPRAGRDDDWVPRPAWCLDPGASLGDQA